MKIFVAGLSKSGKTSRSKHAAKQVTDVEYVSISQLLRNTSGIFPVTTFAEGLANQHIAVDALLALPRSKEHQIIDGHSLIETLEGPFIVPDWFYDKIMPDLILYVFDQPKDILIRRGSIANLHTIAEIGSLTTMEQTACERIAVKLRIPMLALQTPTLEQFSQEVQSRLKANQ